MPAHRQTPAEYAQEIYDRLTSLGAPYHSAMREAREALHDARADDADAAARALYRRRYEAARAAGGTIRQSHNRAAALGLRAS